MKLTISGYFKINKKTLKKNNIYNSMLGIDNRLFVNPCILKKTKIPEFKNSNKKLTTYYSTIIKLIKLSKGDRSSTYWVKAVEMLCFKEIDGIFLGYSNINATRGGRGVGPILAGTIAESVLEVLKSGIEDPEVIEVMGIFQEGFGADRLSDMTIAILKEDFLKYTQRKTIELKIKKTTSHVAVSQKYIMPYIKEYKKAAFFLPVDILYPLPEENDGIDYITSFNSDLRKEMNKEIGPAFRDKDCTKKMASDYIMSDSDLLKEFIKLYKDGKIEGYDFEKDAEGVVSFLEKSEKTVLSYPLKLFKKDSLPTVVEKIILKFKDLIENNGLYKLIYDDGGIPRHERYAQLVFFGIAHSYCETNNIDISPEVNSGRGAVDFKFSRGFSNKLLVEIKLSTNKKLCEGLDKQLEAYKRAEYTDNGFFVLIRLSVKGKKENNYINFHKKMSELKTKGSISKISAVLEIDGRLKPSASKL